MSGRKEEERARERDDLKGGSYYVPCKTRGGSFYKDGGTVEVERRDVHVG